jgi:hypothetical protein
MRSSRGEGGAGVVREKLEAEGGVGNCERLCTHDIHQLLLLPLLLPFLLLVATLERQRE